MHKKRLALTAVLIILAFPQIFWGEPINLEINANSTDLEGKIDTQLEFYESYANIGFGAIYSDNDYLISNLNFAINDQIFTPGLTLGLGFKGLLGEAEINSHDFDLMAISFLVFGEYDFRKEFSNLPIMASVSLSLAPGPLSFSESKRYFDFYSAIYFYLIKNGAFVAGYRAIQARFDSPSGEEKKSDDALFFGIKLSF